MDNLIDDYVEWLRRKFTVTPTGEWYEITTPFLNPHNDYIQIYARKENGNIKFSDDGVTLQELSLAGVNFGRSKLRSAELNAVLNGFGVQTSENEFYVSAGEKDFPEAKHRFIQAILAVYDMFFSAKERVKNFFLDDVSSFFEQHEIRFVPSLTLTGKTGFQHHFDFSIPKSSKHCERNIKISNLPRQDTISSLIFSFEDIKTLRFGSEGIIIINDSEKLVNESILHAVKNYDVLPLLWSRRIEFLELLAA